MINEKVLSGKMSKKPNFKDIVKKREIISFLKSRTLGILNNMVNAILSDDEFSKQKFAYLAGQELEQISFLKFETKCNSFLGLKKEEYEKYLFGELETLKNFMALSSKLNAENSKNCFEIFKSAKEIILHYLSNLKPGEYAFKEEYIYAILYADKNAPLNLPKNDGYFGFLNYKNYNYEKYYSYLENSILSEFCKN